jgi:hypothetical protein
MKCWIISAIFVPKTFEGPSTPQKQGTERPEEEGGSSEPPKFGAMQTPLRGRQMTNDQKKNLRNHHREIADHLERLALELRQEPPPCSWIKLFRSGGIVTSSQAADICQVSAQTIRSWAEMKDGTDHPLGVLIADVWLVDLEELLNLIERRRGKHGRLVCESRARKWIWSREGQPLSDLVATKGQ